mmetsp:Transcript_16481/g.18303  ORF Transcript_16481/g.18303 Transcript_16481/m.18303 type:complete len:510 (+) Transcript_16481:362-1891(+)
MFLAADAGGGHKASAAALIHQFKTHFPGSHCESFQLEKILDVWPYTKLVNSYGFLTARPEVWRVIYHVTNSRFIEPVMNFHSRITCEEIFVKLIESYNPDVIISVHPNTNIVPCAAARKAGQSLNKYIPFFTVVTDLGSGHCGWFQKDVDRLYVGSEKIFKLAKARGQTPVERITLTGLPIRHDFDIVCRRMNYVNNLTDPDPDEVMSNENKSIEEEDVGQCLSYQGQQCLLKDELGLDSETPMVLVMGGGEGTGLLYEIICELYLGLFIADVSCTLCVVCAKNTELKKKFENTNWNGLLLEKSESSYDKYKRILLRSVFPLGNTINNEKTETTATLPALSERVINIQVNNKEEEEHDKLKDRARKVTVVPLGYVTRMAKYMAAAEILITKAGPGTIAEAASLGLPVILTSYLPGQEAGNVGVVLEQNFGTFSSKPADIAKKVIRWIRDPTLLHQLSQNALKAGHPNAASDIVIDIGWRTHTWLRQNAENYEEKKRIISLISEENDTGT